MSDSLQKKLNRVRKPRVHITYDVETNGAQVRKELPFVVGVMGDYSGDNTANRKALRDRKFVQIDRDNFNEIMSKIAPTLDLKVDDALSGEADKQLALSLAFNSMEDFEPENIVRQIEPLRKLMEARNKLRDLMSKADRSEELESLLEQVLQNTESMDSLSKELGSGEEKPAEGE